MQLTRDQIHEQIYFYGLMLICISLPLSVFMTSVGQILIFVNWLSELNFREKWNKIHGNRALQVFLLFFLLHLVGLLRTEDLSFGLKLIVIKLPLIILPLVIASSSQLEMKRISRLLLAFSISVFITSIISVLKLAGWIPGGIDGYRDLSPFIHHIRYALMVVMTIMISVYFFFFNRRSATRSERILYAVFLIWFPVFLLALKSLTGVMVAGVLGFLLLLRVAVGIRDPVIRFMALVPVIMIPLGFLLYTNYAIEKFYNFDELVPGELNSQTSQGNPYLHLRDNREVENGHYVWIYVCEEELEEEWNKVSQIDYHSRTRNGELLKYTLIRFLTSKDFKKDATGVSQLSANEIQAIEKGTANYIYMRNFRLYPRAYEVIWEFYAYSLGKAPNGKSILQRFLYLKAAWSVGRENLLFGVGTGDELVELRKYYETVDSPLSERQRRGPHNEYLSALTCFGIFGLAIFVGSLIVPLFLARRWKSYMASGFLVLLLVSMLSSGTLGSATGAAFTGLFYSLFLFGPTYPWLKSRIFKRNES